MRKPTIAALFPLIAAALAASCGGETTNCADCGGCGIAGPVANPDHDIYIVAEGVDASGVAAVDLQLQEGICKGQDFEPFRLLWSGGAATLQPSGGLGKLDTSKVTFNSQTYTWSDRDLTMSFAQSGTDVLFTFTEGGKAALTKCSGANRKITCTAM